MELTVLVTSRIDKNTHKKLVAYGKSKDWETSKTIRNILSTFLNDKKKTTNV